MPIDFAFTAAIVVSTAVFICLLYKIRRHANAVRNARRAEAEAWSKARAQARAETLMRAYSLAKPCSGPLSAQNPSPTPAYVITPVSEQPSMRTISTDDTPDQPNTVAIHTMTLPIGAGEQAGGNSPRMGD